jgi:methionyl-tRNA formyltransferase
LVIMPSTQRAVLVSFGADQFATLHACCEQGGYRPVAYVYGRSRRPGQRRSPSAGRIVSELLDAIPGGMDLLLPGSMDGLADALRGYRADLMVVYGLSWRLAGRVLRILRHGAINVHTSLLPRYRGPAPVLWALRNGDPTIGVTVHRIDEHFDTGAILAQQGGVPLDEDMTQDLLWNRIKPVVRDLVGTALEHVSAGYSGAPQDEAQASYAGFMEPEFSVIDWSNSARDIHNQVRTFRFMGPGRGPLARIGDRWVRVLGTKTVSTDGIRVDCADGPIWITDYVSAEPPAE